MLPKHYNWFFFPLTILLTLTLLIPTSAHSGKTDSKGGHRDSSTGQYHYHHGYPAHSHYDMDHNGTIDCPYQFKNNTSSSSKTNTKKSTTINSSNIAKSTSISESKSNSNFSLHTTSNSVSKNESKSPHLFLSLLFVLYPLWIYIIVFIASFLKEKFLQYKDKKTQNLEK